jgi:hypothetical protein
MADHISPLSPIDESRYHALRQRVLVNPADLDAWLQLSRLLDGPEQAACLLRAAALLQGTDSPTPTRATVPPAPVPAGLTPRRLGEVLLARGALSADALDQALQEQRRRRAAGDLVPLGDILVDRQFVTPQVLAEALVELHQERATSGSHTPFLLGEYLLDAGLLTASDLVDALVEQIIAARAGRHARLGDILLRRNIITQDVLDRFLAQQQEARARHESGADQTNPE